MQCEPFYPWESATDDLHNPPHTSIFCLLANYLPDSLPSVTMDPTRQFTDRLGVTVDSKSSYLLVAVLLAAGAYAILIPVLSFVRVLFSLFILPGKSVSFHAIGVPPSAS